MSAPTEAALIEAITGRIAIDTTLTNRLVVSAFVQATFAAIRAAGCEVVPRVATPEMLVSGIGPGATFETPGRMAPVYRAMIAASPYAAKEPGV